tara:strand:+ start:288 stop:794 length:507 start_codon:yes stop_codon:yes gene_type:complete
MKAIIKKIKNKGGKEILELFRNKWMDNPIIFEFEESEKVNEEDKEAFAKILFDWKKNKKRTTGIVVNGLEMILYYHSWRPNTYNYLMTLGCYAFYREYDWMNRFAHPRGCYFSHLNNNEQRLNSSRIVLEDFSQSRRDMSEITGYYLFMNNDFNPFEEWLDEEGSKVF